MIKWILLDRGNVQTYWVFSRKKEYTINNKTFLADDLEAIFHSPDYKKFVLGELEEKEIISNFLKDKNFNLTVEEYISLLKAGINAQEGINEILEALFKKYKLAALINEGTAWANYKLDIPNFRKFFKFILISGEIGIKKPDPDFFNIALKEIKAKPEECLFIGDDLKNIDIAKSLGINSILFTTPKKLKIDLAKESIL